MKRRREAGGYEGERGGFSLCRWQGGEEIGQQLVVVHLLKVRVDAPAPL